MTHFATLNSLIKQTLSIQNTTYIYLLRHGQSMGNHSGSIVGWTDSKLSVKGRQQANNLFKSFHDTLDCFTKIHSSDLTRCLKTLEISSGFSGINIKK